MPGDAAEDVATGGLLVFKLMGLMKRGDSSRRREVKKNRGDEGETVILWSFHAHFSHVALSALSRHPSDVYSCVDAEFLTAQPGESELFCVVTATPCARRKKCPVERAADCELQTGKFQILYFSRGQDGWSSVEGPRVRQGFYVARRVSSMFSGFLF